MSPNNRLKLLLAIGVVLIVSVLVALNPQWVRRADKLPKDIGLRQVISNFEANKMPAEFVLDEQALPLFPEDIQNTREGKLIRKGFLSALSVAELKDRYLEYFKQQTWYTGLASTTPAGEEVFNFTKGFSRLGVSITKTTDGARLILDYYPILSAFGPQNSQNTNTPQP